MVDVWYVIHPVHQQPMGPRAGSNQGIKQSTGEHQAMPMVDMSYLYSPASGLRTHLIAAMLLGDATMQDVNACIQEAGQVGHMKCQIVLEAKATIGLSGQGMLVERKHHREHRLMCANSQAHPNSRGQMMER